MDNFDEISYSDVLNGLKSPCNKRDPRAIRLAAVATAIVDVAGGGNNDTNDFVVPASKVYASTVTALEGTLKQKATTSSSQSVFDSLATQVALLDLLRRTVSYVSPVAIITAALPATSRVLCGIVSSSLRVDSETLATETNDELGGINAVLRGTCRATAEILKLLSSGSEDDKPVRKLLYGTLLAIFHDQRPKVRKATHDSLCELLVLESGCHPTVLKSMTQFAHGQLQSGATRYLNNIKHHQQQQQTDLLHLLAFLERSIQYLDISVLGADVMELLVAVLQIDTDGASSSTTATEDFVALSKKDCTSKILTINAMLAVVIAAAEEEGISASYTDSSSRGSDVRQFAPRALANLLQSRPSLTFREGTADVEILRKGRMLYGQAILRTCEIVMVSDIDLGLKLLPVSIQVILQLSRPRDDEPLADDESSCSSVAGTLMTELVALFRSRLAPLMNNNNNPPGLERCIEGSLKTLEQVLQIDHRDAWSTSLKSLAVFIEIFHQNCKANKIKLIIESLVQLRSDVDGDAVAQRAIESAMSSICQGAGMEAFWLWIRWTGMGTETSPKDSKELNTTGICLKRAWILPILKTSSISMHSHRPNLAFFQNNVLALARECDALTATDSNKKNQHKRRVVELWSLFPCFCRNPLDLDTTFPNLSSTLIKAMEDKRYPQLVNIICSGLTAIASGLYEKNQMVERGELPKDSTKFDHHDVEVVSKASTKLLPVLFKKVESLHTLSSISKNTGGHVNSNNNTMDVDGDESAITAKAIESNSNLGGSVPIVAQAIASLAKHAPQPFLQNLFKKLMHRLLEETTQANDKEKLCSLLNLSYALVASQTLEESCVSLLYRAVKPFIRKYEHGSHVQKLAYKVLAEICRQYHSFITQPERLKEFIELLTDTALTSQISARHMRLKCMIIIVEGHADSNWSDMEVISKVCGEALICLKDSNRKSRDAAYQLILSLASVSGENISQFLRVVTAGLGAETSHMRSAAVMALSRIVFEYAREDDNVQSLLPFLLRTVLVLFEEKSREVIKSAVGFTRVSVAAMNINQLEPLLPELVPSLLKYHKGKDRFRAKIKIILKKLVRVYGFDTLMPLVPESESRLLTHMRKLSEREARRKASSYLHKQTDKLGDYDEMIGSDEDDSDEGKTFVTGATGLTTRKTKMADLQSKASRTRRGTSTVASSKSRNKFGEGATSAVRLPNEKDGEVMDILSSNVAQRARANTADNDIDSDSDDSGMMEFDDSGRLVIQDDTAATERDRPADNEETYDTIIAKNGKRRRLDGNQKTRTDGGINVPKLGASYKSKKAGGDVKKKGQKFEPYAYVPLDGKSYSKKNRRRAVEQMETVVRRGGGKRKKS